MVDLEKVKEGDKLYTFRWLAIYQPDDGEYDIQFPVGVKSFYVKEVVGGFLCNFVITRLGKRLIDAELFYTKEEALNGLKRALLSGWKNYKGDKMIKDLLMVQQIVKRLKE